jgi:serine/threonine protein kinase
MRRSCGASWVNSVRLPPLFSLTRPETDSNVFSPVDALRFLRAQNVIHRDIKPQVRFLFVDVHSSRRRPFFSLQNLLLQPAGAADLAAGHPPGIPVLKVADFGFARWLPSQSMAETLCGSPFVPSSLPLSSPH